MDTSFEMKVTKRNGDIEDIAFDKILKRIKKFKVINDYEIIDKKVILK